MGAAGGGSGRSLLALVEADLANVLKTVGEAVESDKQRGCAVWGEDVCKEAAREVGEANESKEGL